MRNREKFFLFPFVPVGTVRAVFRLLHGRTAAVGTRDVFLLFGLGFHLALVVGFFRFRLAEGDAIDEYALEVVHVLLFAFYGLTICVETFCCFKLQLFRRTSV